MTRQWTAYDRNVPLATALTLQYGDTVLYYLGGSSIEHREKMAPYLLHWNIIKDAKQRGFRYYDFWGTAAPAANGGGDTQRLLTAFQSA